MVTAHKWKWTSTYETWHSKPGVHEVRQGPSTGPHGPDSHQILLCAVCTVYQLLFFPVQASSQVQGLLTTNAASEQSSNTLKIYNFRAGSESQAAAPATHRLLNQAHWDTKHCSLGNADVLGQGKPYKLQACLFLSMVSLRRERPSSFWFCNNIHFLI